MGPDGRCESVAFCTHTVRRCTNAAFTELTTVMMLFCALVFCLSARSPVESTQYLAVALHQPHQCELFAPAISVRCGTLVASLRRRVSLLPPSGSLLSAGRVLKPNPSSLPTATSPLLLSLSRCHWWRCPALHAPLKHSLLQPIRNSFFATHFRQNWKSERESRGDLVTETTRRSTISYHRSLVP